MTYNFNNKTLNGNNRYIELLRNEWEIIELLIKMNGQPIMAGKIADILHKKHLYSKGPSAISVRTSICRINNKTVGLIKNRVNIGYYIDEDINIC